MCIRDSLPTLRHRVILSPAAEIEGRKVDETLTALIERVEACLLYTSDAADERSSVDLGGRRIIKKKKTVQCGRPRDKYTTKSVTLISVDTIQTDNRKRERH